MDEFSSPRYYLVVADLLHIMYQVKGKHLAKESIKNVEFSQEKSLHVFVGCGGTWKEKNGGRSACITFYSWLHYLKNIILYCI